MAPASAPQTMTGFMKIPIVDQHFHDIAGNRPQDFVGIDLVPDDRLGGDDGGRRAGNDDVIGGLENGVPVRLDVDAAPDNPFGHGAVADGILDRLDGLPGGGRNAIGAGLEFSIGEVRSLGRRAARKFSLQLGGLFLQAHSHQSRLDERHE